MSELPEGWAEATLLELAGPEGVVTDGDWVESKDQDPNGDIRLTQLADIGDGKFLDRSSRFLNRETAEKLRCTYLQDGDLLIARMPDPLGRGCIFPGVGQRAVTAVDVFIWRADPLGADARWLMHFINSPDLRGRIESEASGTTRQRIAGGMLKELTLPVPPLAEQRRIVAKLDHLLARTARARADLDRIPILIAKYKEALLAAAFSGELTREWRERSRQLVPPAVDRSGIDGRAATLDLVPESWAWTSLSRVALVTGGLTKNPKRNALPNRVPYLRVANVYANELRLDNLAEIGCTALELAKTQLLAGDLLIVEGNGSLDQIGRVAIWGGDVDRCSHQNHIIRARLNEHIVPKFVLYWLLSPGGRSAIERVAASSSGLYTLSITKIQGLPIPICGRGEQHEIVCRIEAAFSWLDKATGEYGRVAHLLRKLDRAILEKAFRGELVLQDPRDEPASNLLARIRTARGEQPDGRRGRRSRRGIVPRAPRERAAMTKSRYDDDVRYKPYLADLLRQTTGSGSVEDLFKRADLTVADFYKQLKWEVDSGHILDKKERLEAV
jgi:type I restriction enzyme S subunit